MLIYRWSGGSPCDGALARFLWKLRPASSATRRRGVYWASALTIVSAALVAPQTAHAHGIAGNRLFPGTLSFDDPAVADEATLPNFSDLNHPASGGNVTDNRINWSFSRLLTPTVAFVVDNSWINRDWGISRRSGADVTNLGIKWEVYRNNLHETLVAASLTWGIGHSGAQGVGANAPDTIKPGIFFGQGFGDLPENLTWLRPFGITGAVVLEHPTGGISTNLGIDPFNRQLGPDADPTCRYAAMGLRDRIQHALFDQADRQRAPQRGASEPVCASGRICIRERERKTNDSDNEPRPIVCCDYLADRG
jgi:hypothetical protein